MERGSWPNAAGGAFYEHVQPIGNGRLEIVGIFAAYIFWPSSRHNFAAATCLNRRDGVNNLFLIQTGRSAAAQASSEKGLGK
jgi:hypothetical protein